MRSLSGAARKNLQGFPRQAFLARREPPREVTADPSFRGSAVCKVLCRAKLQSEPMRKRTTVAVVIVLVLLGSSFLFAKRISAWVVSPRFESSHFRFYSASGDTELARNFESVLERDYARLRDHYGCDLRHKIDIRLFTNNHL